MVCVAVGRSKGIFKRLKSNAVPSENIPKRHFDRTPSTEKKKKQLEREARVGKKKFNFDR